MKRLLIILIYYNVYYTSKFLLYKKKYYKINNKEKYDKISQKFFIFDNLVFDNYDIKLWNDQPGLLESVSSL